MNISVVGLWHLGSVTAAGLASLGHNIRAFDPNEETIAALQKGIPPLQEPGLPEAVAQGLANGTLHFHTDPTPALAGAEIVWIAYDTPVDDDDRADVDFVVQRVVDLFPHLGDGCLVVISAQLPVGSVRRLEELFARSGSPAQVSFACLPENLRLGAAIDAFLKPARIVCGVRSESDRERIARALHDLNAPMEWMSVESAEMTKHALNAFLATSIAYINEVATVCEAVGADAKEVERGLKTDSRIGPRAYLSAGGAFAGGTLARDIGFLSQLAELELIPSVKRSNDAHRRWPQQKLVELWPELAGKTIAIWGLTYKVGTDTLRRSAAVELCRWLTERGATVSAYDPAVKRLPSDLASVRLADNPIAATNGADALVIATEWPEFRDAATSLEARSGFAILDPNGFMRKQLADKGFRYLIVGRGTV
jgi:UDPglucose 6-dehydrogenase